MILQDQLRIHPFFESCPEMSGFLPRSDLRYLLPPCYRHWFDPRNPILISFLAKNRTLVMQIASFWFSRENDLSWSVRLTNPFKLPSKWNSCIQIITEYLKFESLYFTVCIVWAIVQSCGWNYIHHIHTLGILGAEFEKYGANLELVRSPKEYSIVFWSFFCIVKHFSAILTIEYMYDNCRGNRGFNSRRFVESWSAGVTVHWRNWTPTFSRFTLESSTRLKHVNPILKLPLVIFQPAVLLFIGFPWKTRRCNP